MTQKISFIRSVAAAGVIMATLSLTFGYATSNAPTAEAESLAQSNQSKEPGCYGDVSTVITHTDVACVQQVVVEAVPLCPVCPGGVNVVFIQKNKAFEHMWMRQESINALNELEQFRDVDVRVAVISYDSTTVKTEVRMTDELAQARSALRKPVMGHEPFGDFEGAARAALRELNTGRSRHEDKPCELVVFFASTKNIYPEYERNMIKAANMITREGVTLIAGCPEPDPPLYCRATKDMPRPRQFYSEAYDYRMANYVRAERRNLQNGIGLRSLLLRQNLPPELVIVEGSIQPDPSAVDGGVGLTTTLSWLWEDIKAGAGVVVTYEVRAEPLGEYEITGDLRVTDLSRKERVEELEAAKISLTVPCFTPPPPPTSTPLPTPTFTPVPTSTSTSSPTASPTPTPTPGPIYIPMALNELCVPEAVFTDVVLVLDMSTSMERDTGSGETLGNALRAAGAFIDQLNLEGDALGRDQVGIVGFNDQAWIASGLGHDRDVAEAALVGLRDGVAQGTRLDLALLRGQEVLAIGPRQKGNLPVVIVLTDGLPNRVPFGPGSDHEDCDRQECTVLKAAMTAKEAGTRLFTIGLGLPDDLLHTLLRQTASDPGDFYFAPDGEDLQSIYRQIAGKIVECPKVPR